MLFFPPPGWCQQNEQKPCSLARGYLSKINGSPDLHQGIDLRVGESAYWSAPEVSIVQPVSKKLPCASAVQVFADIRDCCKLISQKIIMEHTFMI